MRLPDVSGILDADEVAATVDVIADVQLADGMIPWFPGGHADPWNHVEAAMALLVGGRRPEAERAYQWLVDSQLPNGSWHHYYVDGGVEDPKFDANVCAYPAAGVWHHFLATRDTGFLNELWPVIERAIDWVLELQTPRGEIRWARHADGTPWPTPSSPAPRASTTRCAAPSLWPRSWVTSAPTGSCRPPASALSSPAAPSTSPPRSAGRWTGTTRCCRAC
jgi:hypothetical protein